MEYPFTASPSCHSQLCWVEMWPSDGVGQLGGTLAYESLKYFSHGDGTDPAVLLGCGEKSSATEEGIDFGWRLTLITMLASLVSADKAFSDARDEEHVVTASFKCSGCRPEGPGADPLAKVFIPFSTCSGRISRVSLVGRGGSRNGPEGDAAASVAP